MNLYNYLFSHHNRLLSKLYRTGQLLCRIGARILMYLCVHSGSAHRFSSNFINRCEFLKRSNALTANQKNGLLANPNRLVGLFILGFACIYAVIPLLWYQTILPDSAQNLTWGHMWLWSYNRHPPLGTWLVSFMSLIFNNNEIAVFSSNVLCLSISLFFIYKLSKRYLDSQSAAVACILTSCSMYYLTNYALQFNQNTIMLPFWVMTCYFFDSCLRDNRVKDWLFLAIVTAGSLLAKYESLLIILLLFLYLLWRFEYKFFTRVTMAFVASLALLAPHLKSVAEHGFLTWKFMFAIVDGTRSDGFFYLHLCQPLMAFFDQLSHVLPAILLLLVFVKNKQIVRQAYSVKSTKFNYLIYLGIAPLILVILLSFIFGLRIITEWGCPLFSFTLPAIMSYFQIKSRPSLLRSLVLIALAFHLSTLLIYTSVNYFSEKMSRVNYPSYALAKRAQQYWQTFTSQPLKYVGGDEYIDYYLAAYLPTKPLLLEAFSLQHSPWLNEMKLKKHGIMVVIKGCNSVNNMRLKKQLSAKAYQCIKLALSNKYQEQFTKLTLMVVPPAEYVTKLN